MEVHSPANSVIAKKLWNFVRIAYFMMRKGLISKRKVMMDMNLMMKRGKLMRKTIGNLMFHHHHHHHQSSRNVTHGPFGLEYEFSCSNSPSPAFSHVSKRKHNYFPCINPAPEEDPDEEIIEQSKAVVVVPKNNKIGYSPEHSYSFSFAGTPDLAPGEKLSPLPASPLSKIMISNYSDDEDEEEIQGSNQEVDNEAEEFIRRFYEQLRMQRLLQYQETQYQEMLARGSSC